MLSDQDLRALIDEPDRRPEVSAVELVEAFLARIDAVDPTVNSYISVTPELARSDAERVDRSRAAGRPLALDGLPVAFKDNIDVAGVRTTVGSQVYADRIAERDATVVANLRAAGAVVLGKLHLHEFVYGVTSNNPFYGPCRNPWDLDRIPGGSSGGAGVAVASDLCVGALGSDTGGSIRIPAHLTGVTGLRPTYGAVSSTGAFPIARSFDTVGPLARSALDVGLMLLHMAGRDPTDVRALPGNLQQPDGAGAGGLRIGVPVSDWFFGDLDPEVERHVRIAAEVLEGLGARIVEVEIPEASVAASNDACSIITRAEAYALHRRVYHEERERLGEDTVRRLELGEAVTGAQFADALQSVYEWRHTMRDVLEHVDLVLAPTALTTAPLRAESETVVTTARLTRLTHPFSVAGMPALSMPCGFDSQGLPVGVQIAAAPWADVSALRAAIAFQSVTDWHRRRAPAIFTDA
jgi:aspartyl-tRNA(Asn)/glutamyl-tRNA(Gln) amidotransferase subunit A